MFACMIKSEYKKDLQSESACDCHQEILKIKHEMKLKVVLVVINDIQLLQVPRFYL